MLPASSVIVFLSVSDRAVVSVKGSFKHLCVFCVFHFLDTDYISAEEELKVEQMLAFLTEESKQAAASTAVSTASLFFNDVSLFGPRRVYWKIYDKTPIAQLKSSLWSNNKPQDKLQKYHLDFISNNILPKDQD